MFALRSSHRIAMTGTIFNNNSNDLRSVATFLANKRDVDKSIKGLFSKRLYHSEVQEWMKRYVLRRNESIIPLPPRTERVETVKLEYCTTLSLSSF